MKISVFLLLAILIFTNSAFAARPYKDAYGHSYSSYQNMNKDSDGDGVSNYYDIDDRNPRRTSY